MANASINRKTKSTIDFYKTPTWVTEAFLKAHPLVTKRPILEPCVGSGAIAKVLEGQGHKVVGTDIRNDRDVLGYRTINAITEDFSLYDRFDYVMTNPPFKVAQAMIDNLIQFAERELIIFHRLAFLETSKRSRWLKNNKWLKKVYVLGDRAMLIDELDEDYLLGTKEPSDSGSAVAYAWYVFDRNHKGPVELDWIFKQEEI